MKIKKKLLIATTVADTYYILAGLYRHLSRWYDVTLLTSDGPHVELIRSVEGLKIVLIPMKRNMSPIADFFSICSAIKALTILKPDLVHSYTPKAGFVMMVAAYICNVKVRIHTFTGLVFPSATGLKRFLLVFVDRIICACATKIVPESYGVKNDLVNFKITKKKLTVIGSGNIAGVDTSYFDRRITSSINISNKYSLKSKFVFSYIGRIHRDKGLSELVHSFLKLSGNVVLLLVGNDDPHGELSSYDSQLIENAKNIHKTGYVEDVRAYLAVTNILVLPSYREGFSNALLQAGSMEVPIIATDVSGSNEFVSSKINGWIVPPKNTTALHHAMLSALNTPQSILNDMGTYSRKFVIARFERADHWERMRSFYQEILFPVQ